MAMAMAMEEEVESEPSTPSKLHTSLTHDQLLRISRQKEMALARRRQTLQQHQSTTGMTNTEHSKSHGCIDNPVSVSDMHEWAKPAASFDTSDIIASNLTDISRRSIPRTAAQSSEKIDARAGIAAMEARVDGAFYKSGQKSTGSNPILGLEFKGLDEEGWRSVRKRPLPGHSFGIEIAKEFPESLDCVQVDEGISMGVEGQKKKGKPQIRFDEQKEEEEIQKQKKKDGKFTLSGQQLLVLKAIVEGKSVFVTGSAGTGKSYLLEFAIRILNRMHGADSVFVTASTGLAACAIGGTTLHSFSGVGLGIGTKETLTSKVMSRRESRKRWTKAKALVIDEISMIDGEFLDKLDFVGRSIRASGFDRASSQIQKPFGGLQLVVTGDFFQLPPVNAENDKKAFAFEADCWSRCFDLQIELTHVFRQSDQNFVALLNEVRKGVCSPQTLSKLQGCTGPVVDQWIVPTRLYPHKVDVGRENDHNLRSLRKDILTFAAKDEGKNEFAVRLLENVRAEKLLSLCIGAQVMLVKNLNTEIGLVNGARGIVVRFAQEEDPTVPEIKETKSVSPSEVWPVVRFACDGLERVMHPESWTVLEGDTEVAKRTQVPLILAWALSVHKCQDWRAMANNRRPCSSINSAVLYNEKEADGTWIGNEYQKASWVLMHPSAKGTFRQKKMAKYTFRSYWKGRILDFRASQGGKSVSEVLVQHVYMHSEVNADSINRRDYRKCNYLYPSNISEWEPSACLVGVIQVIHSEIGKLQYKERSSKDLAESNIFFYDTLYIPNKNGGLGRLENIPLPDFKDKFNWIPCSNSIIHSFRSKLLYDIQKSLKISTGSKNVHLNWFIPISLFASVFSNTNVRRTPTLFICDHLSDEFLHELMDKGWDTKSDGEIDCRVDFASMCFRYSIEKQTISLVFHYQRWKNDHGQWFPLDQDFTTIGHSERISIDIRYCEAIITTMEVEKDWTLFHVRKELVILQDNIPDNFCFIANGTMIRSRHEDKILCKDVGEFLDIIAQS